MFATFYIHKTEQVTFFVQKWQHVHFIYLFLLPIPFLEYLDFSFIQSPLVLLSFYTLVILISLRFLLRTEHRERANLPSTLALNSSGSYSVSGGRGAKTYSTSLIEGSGPFARWQQRTLIVLPPLGSLSPNLVAGSNIMSHFSGYNDKAIIASFMVCAPCMIPFSQLKVPLSRTERVARYIST
jgi:hypothetical protein